MKPAPDSAAAVSLWLGGVLALAAFSLQVVPVLAPAVAADAGLPAAFVGAYSAGLWGVAIVGSIAAPALLARFGAWRTSQGCLALCALGVVAVAGGHPLGLVAGAVLIGFGHGLEGPVASQLLATHVAPTRRPLWFSIKQTGVQVGAVFASAALPALALALGWRGAALSATVLAAAGALLLALPRRRYPEAPRDAAAPPRLGVLATFRATPVLRRLALVAGCFGATQICLNSFFVTFAVRERGASLVEAGAWLAGAQAGGLVGRVLWGWIGNRAGATWVLLMGLGGVMAFCSLALGLGGSKMAAPWLWPLLVVFGLTASGWNGLFLAEVARQVPVAEAGAATAAVLVVMTAGLVIGPLVFSALASATSFGSAFALWSGVAAAGVMGLASARGNFRR